MATSKKRWAIAEASDRNCRGAAGDGLRQPLLAPAGGGQCRAHRGQRALERPRRRLLLGIEDIPADAAVGAAGHGCVSDHQGRDDGGRHHRLLDCRLAGAGADRGGDRQLARLCRRAQGRRPPRRACSAACPRRPPRCCCRRRRRSLKVENLSVAAPGTQTRTARAASASSSPAGTVLAVIGPSAAGKSTLARALTGVWPLSRGAVRLDGAALSSWSPEELGRHIGYLPQDVQLFDGTITENIARFEEQPDSQRVIAASAAAGVHEMVLRLPNGYETRIGEGGVGAVGGPAPAHRAGTRALWRAVPAGPGRAQLQSRRRRREGPRQRHRHGSRRAAASSSSSRTGRPC